MDDHWLILRVDERMNHTWLIARNSEERARAAKHPDTMYILPWKEEVHINPLDVAASVASDLGFLIDPNSDGLPPKKKTK